MSREPTETQISLHKYFPVICTAMHSAHLPISGYDSVLLCFHLVLAGIYTSIFKLTELYSHEFMDKWIY